MLTLAETIEAFLAGAPHAVVGASSDRSKFGNKVLRAYQGASRPVFAVNPKGGVIEGLDAVRALSDLPGAVHGISVITPPPVTEAVVQEAARMGIRHVWLQPGAESDAAVRAGEESGLSLIYGGPCLLVELPKYSC